VSADGTVDGRLADVMSDIQMPLENLAFTIEAYLMENGTRLDTETRFLLAGARDCADRVAGSVRQVAREKAAKAARPQSAEVEDRERVDA
jgi:hypothetical protein